MIENCRRAFLLLTLAILLPACGIGGGSDGTLTPTVAPSAPDSISSRSGNGRVSLSWPASSAATGYTVKRSTSSGGPYSPVADVATTSYVDTGLTNTTPYYYVIAASNPYGTSGDSDELRAVPGLRPKLLACGGDHTLLFLEDDTLWAAGLNDLLQLGPGAGAIQSSNVFVPSTDLRDVTALAAGYDFSLALRSDGTVWGWGSNNYGTLGVDPAEFRMRGSPEPIPGLDSVVAIAAVAWHALALRSDGTVWSWGRNQSGQLGRLQAQDVVHTPGQLANLSDIVALAAGDVHGLALKRDGTVWAWGSNTFGEIANLTAKTDPGRVYNVSGIVSVAAGTSTSFALDGSGTVWAWGYNGAKALGLDSTYGGITSVKTPTPTGDTRRVLQIGAGSTHTAFLHSDGTVAIWGSNSSAEFGNGTTSSGITGGSVAEVPGLSDVAKIVVGQQSNLAVKKDGSLWGWGYADFGNFGSGVGVVQVVPIQVPGLTDILSFGLGTDNGFVMMPDQTVWAWGGNSQGSVGNGTNVNTPVRTRVFKQGISQAPLTGATSLAGGLWHSIARLSDGTVWTWGNNGEGQLGNGSTPNSTNLAGLVAGLTGVASVAAGPLNSYAIMNDKTARAWGKGGGLLGNNSPNGSSTPVTVKDLTDVKTIVAGWDHAQALLNNGTVCSWGSNTYGALGTGPGGDSLVPVPILEFSDVVSIAAGAYHTVAAKGDGTVWVWGLNDSYQLGDSPLPSSNVPIQMKSLSNVAAVASCYATNYALRKDGTVWAWGNNFDGELANSMLAGSAVPLQVPGITDATALYACDAHAFVRRADGSYWGWGLNRRGTLGIGTDEYVRSPMEVTR